MKIFLLTIFCFSTWFIHSQVIINRDASRPQFVINSANQFEISTNNYNQAIWNIGKAVSVSSSAQLELASSNKAFLINRVKLASVQDKVTIPNPKDGMMTYNTNTAGTYPDNVIPGLFYMSEGIWWRISDIDPQNSAEVHLHDLQAHLVSASVASASAQAQWGSAATLSMGSIIINTTGTYTFSIRLYGKTSYAGSVYQRGVGYLYLVKNGTTLIDFQEVVIPFSYQGAVITYTIVLMSPVLNAGDQITLKLATPSGSPTITLLSHIGLRADKTSLIYWKN
ncbi:hypothetical protein CLV62_14127 [Dysgonomonas alginatilytica]|uniref:C1q domain-containing protein n=1 Tax=Dysgonomonas alginatilytica TaxID=1605892 RepID=A0A2V3PKL8_9BACT|nr:hypothetical protein [Dysgonomonas alginatilytica]PXV58916.1 hypothetical protein CLV62_14127 [Dysgonomonas alginatilytica]